MTAETERFDIPAWLRGYANSELHSIENTDLLVYTADLLDQQAARIAELEARLELTASDGTRLDIGDCDGIACRDETIRLLEAELSQVRAERDSLKSQLGINASLDARLTDNVAEHWRRENERLRAKLATLSRPPDHDDNMRRFVTGCPKCDPPRPTAPEGEPVYGFPAESPLDDERRRTGFFPAYHSPPDCLETEPQEPEPQEPEPEGEPLYFIQCTDGACGNEALWWRPEGAGYTTNLADAGRYTEKRARGQERVRSIDKAWPVDVVMRLSHPSVKISALIAETERQEAEGSG